MEKSEKLKPCPFCGGEARVDRYNDEYCRDYYLFFTRCQDCKVRTPEIHSHIDDSSGAYERAIKVWNRRTP